MLMKYIGCRKERYGHPPQSLKEMNPRIGVVHMSGFTKVGLMFLCFLFYFWRLCFYDVWDHESFSPLG
jgi:hypothetical protein